jgi:phytoene synthase
MTTEHPLDSDRVLALSYVHAARRAALAALWRLDLALGAVVARGREPMIGRIKLAWWRDALAALDVAAPPPEPLLQAVGRDLVSPGLLRGAELAAMEEGWSCLLTPEPLTAAEMDAYAAGRGGLLFGHSARLLKAEASAELVQAGEAWALVDLARRSSSAPEREAALQAARARSWPQMRWPSKLRPLGMLAVLARRDAEARAGGLEKQGSPSRMLRMVRHRLSGR